MTTSTCQAMGSDGQDVRGVKGVDGGGFKQAVIGFNARKHLTRTQQGGIALTPLLETLMEPAGSGYLFPR